MKSPLAFSCNLPKRGPPWKFIFLTIERSKPVTDLSYSPSFRFSVKLVARFSSSHAMTLSFHSLHRIFFFFFFFFLLFFTSPSRESISFLSLFSPRPVRRRRVYSYHMEQFPPSYLRKDIFWRGRREKKKKKENCIQRYRPNPPPLSRRSTFRCLCRQSTWKSLKLLSALLSSWLIYFKDIVVSLPDVKCSFQNKLACLTQLTNNSALLYSRVNIGPPSSAFCDACFGFSLRLSSRILEAVSVPFRHKSGIPIILIIWRAGNLYHDHLCCRKIHQLPKSCSKLCLRKW